MGLEQINQAYYDFLTTPAREYALYGGSASGKSTTVIQFLCFTFLNSKTPTRILIARKWLSAMRNTVMVDLLAIFQAWGVMDKINWNKSSNVFSYGENRIEIMGLDNPEKIKGANYSYIWLEEATDFDLEDYQQLKLRLGRSIQNKDVKFIFTFNPIDPNHFTWTDLVCTEKPNRIVRHSTFLDNIDNLSPEWIEELLALKETDPNYYNIYVLGQPGAITNLIYSNVKISPWDLDKIHTSKTKTAEIPDCCGLDFGFNNPTALVIVKQTADGFRVKELIYKRHMTNGDLISELKAHKTQWFLDRIPIYCDTAEPNRIEELRRAGFDARPANKDVKLGIDFCKRYEISIDPGSTNLIKEIRGYKYREDKNGNVLDEPLKFNDHGTDGIRYGIYTHFGREKQIRDFKFISFGNMGIDDLL